MKVLQINKLYYPWIGGVEKVIQDIAEGLQGKVDMEVLTCQPIGRGSEQLINKVKVIKASSLGIYWGMPVSFTFPFLLAWKSQKADILHFHLPFPLGVLSYLLMASKKKKVVVTYHSDIVRQERLMRFYKPFLHRFLKRADKILPTSPNLVKSSKYLSPYKDKCTVVPLSIDLNEFGHLIKKKLDLGFSPDEKIVLFVGRLNYYKGLEYLIEAIQEVESKLLIVGEGEMRERLEQKVKSLGVEQKIVFLGKVSGEELKYCYQICDLFVLPSIEPSEAFGIVQMEAMAYGKPVVNTNLPTGVPYVSINGETGFTVPPRDAKALAKAINKILNDKELATKFSKNALKRVKKKFSKEKMLESIYQIYNELM
ncbi:MAG TPA: mannosyltransferase [Candidatus Atribacteria bacterium]|nr:mannosyltransferase [Candidatus Atribacteria bacterium]